MIYFVVFILLLIPVVKYDWMAKTGGEKGWYYFNMIVLILLAGLRYRVGGDTLLYMGMFEGCPKFEDLKYFDFETAKYNPLWYVLNAVSRSIYDDFTLFQLIHATILHFTFFHFFRKYCPQYYFSSLLLYYIGYFCYFNMEVMRESLCVCILLWAVDFLLSKRWLFYYSLCVVALLFHYSAAIMFLFPCLYVFKRPSCVWEIILLLSIVLCMNVVNLPSLLLNIFGINEQLTDLINNYLDDSRNIIGIISELLNYLPIFVCIWIRERYEVKEHHDFTFIIMGTVVIYALAMSLGILNRFINYFVPFIIVYIVNTLYRVLGWNFKERQVSFVFCVGAFLLFNFNLLRFYTSDLSEVYPNTRAYVKYYPYHSSLIPKIDEHRERFIENYRDISIMF